MRALSASAPAASSRKKRTLYEVLDVPRSSDKKAIKTKFYELSMKYHPDKNPLDESAHSKFLEINEAYSVLGDDARRREYDSELGGFGAPVDDGMPRSGPRSYRSSRATRPAYPSKLRPDDWIQFRGTRPGAGKRGDPNEPNFNYQEHSRAHYGNTNPDIERRAEHYRRMYEGNMAEPKIIRIFLLSSIIVFIWYSGYIQMIWLEDDANDIESSIANDGEPRWEAWRGLLVVRLPAAHRRPAPPPPASM
nr:DnaJ- protein scj1 [Polyrhizophydium stewartii]